MAFSAGLLSISIRPSFRNAFKPFALLMYILLPSQAHFCRRMVTFQPSLEIFQRLALSIFAVSFLRLLGDKCLNCLSNRYKSITIFYTDLSIFAVGFQPIATNMSEAICESDTFKFVIGRITITNYRSRKSFNETFKDRSSP